MNEGMIWDGLTGSKNDLRRAEGRKTTPDATDFDALVRETIATQKGVAICGDAIRKNQSQLQDLQAQLDSIPDDVAALAENVIGAQTSLADVAGNAIKAATDQKRTAEEAIATLREQLEAFRKTTPTAKDWAALMADLTAAQESAAVASKTTGDAIRDYCAQRDDLLDGFNSVGDARYWLEQSRRIRHYLAEVLEMDPSEVEFVSERESSKCFSREERQGYERGRTRGYKAGYARGYSEAAKGLPCRLNLPNPL